MVTVALVEDVELATLVAVTVADPADGTDSGAMYNPDDVIVPVVELPPATPLTDHVTPVLLVPETVAVNCFEVPTCKLAEVGEIVTVIEVELGNQGHVFKELVPYSNSPRSRPS